jgi:hypothetical protein
MIAAFTNRCPVSRGRRTTRARPNMRQRAAGRQAGSARVFWSSASRPAGWSRPSRVTSRTLARGIPTETRAANASASTIEPEPGLSLKAARKLTPYRRAKLGFRPAVGGQFSRGADILGKRTSGQSSLELRPKERPARVSRLAQPARIPAEAGIAPMERPTPRGNALPANVKTGPLLAASAFVSRGCRPRRH